MQLTTNFTLEELIHSDTAEEHRLVNLPGPLEVEALHTLAVRVLQPLREALGPLRITSGYRCLPLNDLVGGAAQSQHLLGEAADLVPVKASLAQVMSVAVSRLEFDQVILEFGRWIHVSFTGRRPNRRQALTSLNRDGKTVYPPYQPTK